MSEAAPTPAPGKAHLAIHKGPDAEFTAGGLRFVACRREIADIDGGISLYVWTAPAAGESQELLRFDLFRNRPHYHAPAENQQETKIDPASHADVAEWGVDALTQHPATYVRQAGYDDVAASLDAAALSNATAGLRQLFDDLTEPDEVSYFEIDAKILESLRG
ncbi:MAG: hypothetical protein AAF430_24090 [Myxococcota bacterium]